MIVEIMIFLFIFVRSISRINICSPEKLYIRAESTPNPDLAKNLIFSILFAF